MQINATPVYYVYTSKVNSKKYMSMMFCAKCDALFDTDNDVDCPHCTEESFTEPKTIEEMMDDDSADDNYDGQD